MVLFTRIAPGLSRARTMASVAALAGVLGACASIAPEGPAMTGFSPVAATGRPSAVAASAAPHAANSAANSGGGRYKVGAPYQAGGVWYVPAEQPGYEEVGLASWYGDAFNGKHTANGEVFDMHLVSAAHATLPMPCIVEVTNLDNGKVMQVRMNDRGPYHPGRIIDLSRAGAEQLGYAQKGTARVRVRYVGPAPLDGMAAPVTLAAGPRDFAPSPSVPSYPSAASSQPFHPAPAAGSGYVVQAGAYSTRGAAELVVVRLASAGRAAVKPLDRSGATLYRVVVGPWPDNEAALAARGRVAALGFNDARVTTGF